MQKDETLLNDLTLILRRNEKVKPRNASTLIIKKKNNLEEDSILMLLRHPGNAFVPSAWVFPGGAIESEDHDIEEFCVPLMDDYNKVSHKEDASILPYFIASIRETFEETGILYAYKNNELLSINSKDDMDRFAQYRKKLYNKELTFRDILEKENLTLAVDTLSYIDRWVTPSLFPIRYDARFFYTNIVPNQEVSIDEIEVVKHKWITPSEAIKKNKTGEFPMVLPTVSVLKKIS